MKKAKYFLYFGLIAVLVAWALKVQEVKDLQKQTSIYEQQIVKLNNTIKQQQAKVFELSSLNELQEQDLVALKNIIDVKRDTIIDLRKKLKLQQEQEEKAKLASAKATFDLNNVTIPSNITAEKLEMAIAQVNPTFAKLAPKFVELEKAYGINAIYLASKTAWESGWGTSDQAIYKNNIGGVKNPGGYDYRTFASKEACLDYIAKFLSISYLDENGTYYNGKSVSGISQMYNFGDVEWTNGIISIAHGLVAKANQLTTQ